MREPGRGDDGGFAMISAVIVSALIVAITAALLISLDSGGRESARQREVYEARATGVAALEYLYAELHARPYLFEQVLAEDADAPSWLGLGSDDAPSEDENSDWSTFEDDFTVAECTSRSDPCWAMRFNGNLSDPTAVVVEAIVRFDCRNSDYCAEKRFQQQMLRASHLPVIAPDAQGNALMALDQDLGHEWRRLDLTEVATKDSLEAVVIDPAPGQVTGVTVADIMETTATVTWSPPADGGTPIQYHVDWKPQTEADYLPQGFEPSTTTTYQITGLTAATPYDVRVRGSHQYGSGPWSAEVQFTTASSP